MKLLLWDIDGTLVNVRRLGARAMNEALHELYGREAGIPARSMAGKTDLQILGEFLGANAIPFSSLKSEGEKVIPLYETRLGKYLADDPGPFVYPNAEALLERYHRSSSAVNGLLTGNFMRTAKLKLEHFSLWKYFELGAYGETSDSRADLVPAALKEYEKKRGRKIAAGDVWVIGDTPNDVAITKTHGLRSVAVASGGYSTGDLAACGPDILLKDLTEFPVELFD